MAFTHVLDKQFIEKIIDESVAEYSISAGSNPGDNIKGTLLRVDVTTTSNKLHNLLIKSVLPMSGNIDQNVLVYSKFIAATNVFAREIEYYDKIRPIFQKAWENDNANRQAVFTSPKLYSVLHDPETEGLKDYIIMEDLRPSGYKMADKCKGLTFAETVATLKQLAILHATSYCLLNGNNNLSTKFKEISNDPESLMNLHAWNRHVLKGVDHGVFFDSIVSKMLDLVENDGKGELAEKIRKICQNGYESILMKLWKQTNDKGKYFRVLIHGDLWTNNILFKHAPDGKSVENASFIDLQMTRFGNIYEDLHYFVFTSTTAEFRQAHLPTSLMEYFTEFENVVMKLDSQMPSGFTQESLSSTFHETLSYGFVYNILAIPYQLGLPASPPREKSNLPESKKSEETESEPNFQKMFDNRVIALQTSAKNSPLAMQRLYEMIKEMVIFGLIH